MYLCQEHTEALQKKDGCKMIEKSFVFSRSELALLLSKYGIESFYGFDLSSSDKTQKQMLLLINRLVRNGMLDVGDSSLVFNKEIEKIMCCIANSNRIIVFYPGDLYGTIRCCYVFNEKTIVTQVADTSEDKIKLSLVKTEDLYDYVFDGIFSDAIIETDAEDDFDVDCETEQTIRLMLNSFPHCNSSTFRRFENVECIAESVNKNSGETSRFCAVLSGAENTYIAEIKESENNISLFSDNSMKRCFCDLM